VAVALAIADFELGDSAGALARLDAAAGAPELDPTTDYVRAEILRDTDRPAALRALERYTRGCLSVGCSDAAREERAATLTQLVTRCLAEEVPVCEGDWEHPRAVAAVEAPVEAPAPAPPPPPPPAAAPPPADPSDGTPLAWLLGLSALLALTGVWAVFRRRRR
jgi:hypothetical protein